MSSQDQASNQAGKLGRQRMWKAAQFQHKLKRKTVESKNEILLPLGKQNEIDPSLMHAIANMTRQHVFS